jgi:hypothetical protein
MCYDQEKTQAPEMGAASQRAYEAELKSRFDQMGGLEATLNQMPPPPMRPMSDGEILRELFSYHPPTPATLPKFAAINQAAKNFAEIVLQNCPPSADRSDAIRKIREARMTANAAVALGGLSL